LNNSSEQYQDSQAIDCKICGDKAWLTFGAPVGHPNFGKVLPCECQEERLQEERVERLLNFSNLKQLYRYNFETIDPTRIAETSQDENLYKIAYDAARKFADNPTGWIILKGATGVGKTHLAAAIGNQLVTNEHPVFYVFVPDLLDHLRSTYGPSSEVSYDDLFEQVRNTPVLILDDLGAQSSTPWAQEKLYQLLNHRFNLEMPTIITLEKSLSTLDEQIARRILDKRISTIYEMDKSIKAVHPALDTLDIQMLKRMKFETFDVNGNKADIQGRETLDAALRAAKSFAKSPEGWLTFAGTTGCGKTHLAVAMAGEWRKRNLPLVFTFVPRLLDHLRRTFSADSRIRYDDLFEQIIAAPILVLDDLGAESSTSWAEEKLYQIIVHRHNLRLPTVITSRDVFFKDTSYTEPIVSRIKDPTVNILIKIGAPDYRNKDRYPDQKPDKLRRTNAR